MFEFDWELTTSPAGAKQWTPKNPEAQGTVPDAHDPSRRHAPMMLTTDLALRVDPAYEAVSRRFHADQDAFAHAFAEAWYKLTHRDMGPLSRLLGADVPAEPRIWQDPLPAVDHPLIDAADIAALKQQILASGISVARLVTTAWASASTFRASDKRGGANGARIRLAPQKDWAVNEPAELARVIATLEAIQRGFGKPVSLADLIVLGGCAAIEQASGNSIEVPFTPGRADATQDQTDADSFAPLEPKVDGFRNYASGQQTRSVEEVLVDRAQLLTLTAPEMTALLGGLRVLGVAVGNATHGVLTHAPGTLSNDFFVNLLSAITTAKWEAGTQADTFVAKDRRTGAQLWTGTRVDLIFGSNSQLRALAETYAADDAKPAFMIAFVKAWTKVMNLDRFDVEALRW